MKRNWLQLEHAGVALAKYESSPHFLAFSMCFNTRILRIGFTDSWSPVVPHLATCWAWQARHLVHAPLLLIYSEMSAGLRAPKATAGFMNGVRPQRRQCVQRYSFLVGCKLEVVSVLWLSRRLISLSTWFRSSAPRNFCSRTWAPRGGPLVKTSRGNSRKSHTVIGFLARESMTYPQVWVSSVGISFSSSVLPRSTKAAERDCP